MALYKEKRAVEGLYALCTTRMPESYHHWRAFSENADASCIEFKRQPLEAALDYLDGIRIGAIEYRFLDEIDKLGEDDRDRLPFVKRIGFIDEQEHRVLLETTETQADVYAIDMELNWIKRIILNPGLPPRQATTLKQIIREIDGCSRLKVEHSRLTDSARWKKAGDKIASVKHPEARTLKLEKKARRRLK